MDVCFKEVRNLGQLEKTRGNLDNKPVAQRKLLSGLSGRPVGWSGGHLQARRARLQARRADVEALCILLPRPVAPSSRPVAPP